MRAGKAAMLVLTLLAGTAAAQQDPAAAARTAAGQLAAAAADLARASEAEDRVAALTRTVRAYEDGLALLRENLRRLTIARGAQQARLKARETEIAELLALLQRIDPGRTPALLLHPAGALGAARGAMLMADLAPALRSEATMIAAEIARLGQLAAAQEAAMISLSEGRAGAEAARAALATAASERRDLPRRFEEDPVQRALLMASAGTLEALAAGLATTSGRADAADALPAVAAGQSIMLPVRGRVIHRPGEPDAAGLLRPGILVATRPRALVTAPVTATVRFAGPFPDHGMVVILEPATDVLFVLAGLGEVWPVAGEILPAGAAIGLMGSGQPPAEGFLHDSSPTGAEPRSETLYLEVRVGDGPANPADWFALVE
jgi:septal ring factor EnvC (AmiA/AmiB activator)